MIVSITSSCCSGETFLSLPVSKSLHQCIRNTLASETPQNGRLQILGAANGQFAKIDYQPPMNLRDFYIFPYDVRHCVYPFNETFETRRTLAANCDVLFDPIKNRGAT